MGSRQQAAPSWISFWSAMACHRRYIFTWQMSILSMSPYTGSMLKMGKAHHHKTKTKKKIELGLHRPLSRTWQVRVAGNRPLETGEKKKGPCIYNLLFSKCLVCRFVWIYGVCAFVSTWPDNDKRLLSNFLPVPPTFVVVVGWYAPSCHSLTMSGCTECSTLLVPSTQSSAVKMGSGWMERINGIICYAQVEAAHLPTTICFLLPQLSSSAHSCRFS